MFILSTDTSCDVKRDELDKLNVPWVPLTFTIGDFTYDDNFTTDADFVDFYDKILAGAMPTTSQINTYLHEEFFEQIIANQKGDVVHVSLSEGLSGTFLSARLASVAVMERHPDRKIYVVSTLSATQGNAFILHEGVRLRDSGTSALDAFNALNDFATHVQHLLMADDLHHLKRGGRVSGAAAAVGTLLNIKPVMTIGDDGKLAVINKPRGVHKALRFFVDKYKEYCADFSKPVYIANAGASDKAEMLKELLVQEFNATVVIGWVGPVIGAHTGSGALGMVFYTTHRINS